MIIRTIIAITQKFVHPCFWSAWLILSEKLNCKRARRPQSFNPFRRGTEIVSEGSTERNCSSWKRKQTKKQKQVFSALFKVQYQFSKMTAQSTVSHSGQQWMHREDHQKMTSTQQYYPGTTSQLPDTTGATQVASFSSIQTR